jgi:TetR/AcrR family transcriptional regulator
LDVRSQILSTATRLFARRGFDGTSLSAIAEEVGIRKPSLLYHFPSKDTLRRSVLEELSRHWAEVLPRVLSTISSGHERFDALGRELMRFFETDPDRARLVIRELMDRPEEMQAQLTEAVTPFIALLTDYIDRGKKEGLVRPDVDPAKYLVHIITLVLTGMAARPVLLTLAGGGDDASFREELLRIARTSLFLDGYEDK